MKQGLGLGKVRAFALLADFTGMVSNAPVSACMCDAILKVPCDSLVCFKHC